MKERKKTDQNEEFDLSEESFDEESDTSSKESLKQTENSKKIKECDSSEGIVVEEVKGQSSPLISAQPPSLPTSLILSFFIENLLTTCQTVK